MPAAEPSTPKFCGDCGARIVPLEAVPHVRRPCDKCDKQKYCVERDRDTRGIVIREGDTFTIPKGAISISLDPSSSNMKLTRPGVTWLMNKVYFELVPGFSNTMQDKEVRKATNALLDGVKTEGDAVLNESEIAGLSNDCSEDEMKEAWDRVAEQPHSKEKWALIILGMRELLLAAIESGDVNKAVLLTYIISNARAMLIFNRDLESHVWEGYLTNCLVHKAGAAAKKIPSERKALNALEPIFDAADEDLLHMWVHDGHPIGPRIGMTELSETSLKTMAEWHLKQRDEIKTQYHADREEKRKSREELIKVVAILVSIAVAIIGVTGVIASALIREFLA